MSLKKYLKKKITATLSEKAEKYYDEVAYSLDYGDGKIATQSQVISHCLEELALFEEASGQSVTDYLKENCPQMFEKEELFCEKIKEKNKE